MQKPAKRVRVTKTSKTPSKSIGKRIRRRLFRLVLVVVLFPLVLGLIYIPANIHPVSTLMLFDRLQGKKVDRRWVPIERIAPVLANSVIMSEDGQYCSHRGVDWNAINMVIDDVMEGEKARGASTITMQVVKNLFLWNSRSYFRKMLEVPLALYVDFIWSKRRQMEIYLNIAEWGPGIFGIEAAARYHFGRPASRLNAAQAALLAVTLPNPALRNPRKPSRRMQVLARINGKRARQAGPYIGCLSGQ